MVEIPIPTPPYKTGNNEGVDLGSKSGSNCGYEIQNANPQQRLFPTKSICRPTSDQSSQYGAPQGHAHRESMNPSRQSPELLNPLFGPRNNDGIEAKNETR